nr:MAG TPA: hypothetical protein [Caudoviricetes sp.]
MRLAVTGKIVTAPTRKRQKMQLNTVKKESAKHVYHCNRIRL